MTLGFPTSITFLMQLQIKARNSLLCHLSWEMGFEMCMLVRPVEAQWSLIIWWLISACLIHKDGTWGLLTVIFRHWSSFCPWWFSKVIGTFTGKARGRIYGFRIVFYASLEKGVIEKTENGQWFKYSICSFYVLIKNISKRTEASFQSWWWWSSHPHFC